MRADPALRQIIADALTSDEVSLLAQERGFQVSGSDILHFHGQSASGIRISRIDHPGDYPGRYFLGAYLSRENQQVIINQS